MHIRSLVALAALSLSLPVHAERSLPPIGTNAPAPALPPSADTPWPGGAVTLTVDASDTLSRAFKATHGKRLFKMAPLHHHFELCGWSEVKLVAVFTSVSALCCLAALFGVLNRFHF